MNLRVRVVYILILLGSLVAFPQRASADDDQETLQARKHYQQAQKQFDLGMWDAAVDEFSKAYELRPDPTFLFNMAQAYRRAGNARRAIDLYKNYLIKVPKSPQRADIEERIKSLQKQLDEEEREGKRAAPTQPGVTTAPAAASLVPPGETGRPESTTPERSTPPEGPPMPAAAPATIATRADLRPTGTGTTNNAPSTTAVVPLPDATTTAPLAGPPAGSRPFRIAGIVTSAVGAAGIGAGIFFSLRTKSLSNSVSKATQYNPSDARLGQQAATLQWVCYLAGGAAVVTGGLLYWKGRVRNGEQTTVGLVPMLAPASAGLLASGSF